MKKLLLVLLYIVGGITIGLSLDVFAQESGIPNWVKGITNFWVSGDVSDNDFEKAVQYLVEHKIIKISELQQNSQSIQSIPHWIKNLAGMWINGMVSDDDFTKAIEYLVNTGIIPINVQSIQTNMQNQTISTPTSSVITTTNQAKNSLTSTVSALPMLMLTSNSDRVYMKYDYKVMIKIFDPKSNPQKIFDQFIGGIPDVNITVAITDPDNNIIGQSSGKTDSKGIYQDKITIPYMPHSQVQTKIMINATKNGYVAQQSTLPLLLVRYNS
jgi:hypothetical protein